MKHPQVYMVNQPDKDSVTIRIGDTTMSEEDLKRMKLAAEFLNWLEGGEDTELQRQWIAFKAFKRISE